MKPFPYFLLLFPISLLGCGPHTNVSQAESVEISESILFLEGMEEKVRTYLSVLDAQSIDLDEVYDEDAEIYTIEAVVLKSKKFEDQPKSNKASIARKLAEFLASNIDYADYYKEIIVFIHSQPQSHPDILMEGNEVYIFPMNELLSDPYEQWKDSLSEEEEQNNSSYE